MKRRIRLTEGDLHRIVKQSVKRVLNESIDKTYITYNGIKLLLSMNGDDMYIEYTENGKWVLAGYYANEKLWVVQENLDQQMVADGEDDIITIAKTKSMPEALAKMSQYIKYATH
jgi:hypothetical protein